MRWSAALASALIAGCAGFTGAAAGKATGTKPMTPPPTKAPRVAIYRSFTELSSLSRAHPISACLRYHPGAGAPAVHFWKSCRKDEREILPAAEEPALPGPGTCRNGQTVGLARIE